MGRNLLHGRQTLKADGRRSQKARSILWRALPALCVPQCYSRSGRRCQTSRTPIEKVMDVLDDLVRQARILYAGISDAPAWWVAQAITIANLRGWPPFVAMRVE